MIKIYFLNPDSILGLEKASLECGSEVDDIYSFTIPAESPLGPINLMFIQHDGIRKMPFTSTALYNSLNHEVLVDRVDNFRELPCSALEGKQNNCSSTFRMTPEQQSFSGKYSFDRGHLTPINPMRFSESAADVTFYCVNIAPQDPYTNQFPWFTVENVTHHRLASTPGYVMTGLCDRDSTDGPTLSGWRVAECFWKLVCYKDSSKVTRVVGFIGNNQLLPADNLSAQNERTTDTITPRSQYEIMDKMDRPEFIQEAWREAEHYLLENRDETGAPEPNDCIDALTAPDSVLEEWRDIMRNAK